MGGESLFHEKLQKSKLSEVEFCPVLYESFENLGDREICLRLIDIGTAKKTA